MARGTIAYTPRASDGFSCVLTTELGNELRVIGSLDAAEPGLDGDVSLVANPSLVNSLWAYAVHESQYRRLRNVEKRKSHREEADRQRAEAVALARLVERPRGTEVKGWCSACYGDTAHGETKTSSPVKTYLCRRCGSPTVRCLAPQCTNMATARAQAAGIPRYCAEHRHDIPSFESLDGRLDQLEDYEKWLAFERPNLARITRTAAIAVAAGLVLAPGAFFAAPLIGGATGALSGLSGAAATSHGLALWGGGSLAAGGLGMAGGTVVITALGTGIGGTLGALTTVAYTRSDSSFKIEKLRDGTGSPVLLASGFLTEGEAGWGGWKDLVDQRYPDHPVYRVHWGAKELKALGGLIVQGAGQQGAAKVLRFVAAKASKQAAKVPGLGAILLANDIARNPWSVAKTRAAMTGAVLSDLIARTDDERFILIGHSLGARVMVTAAQGLGTKTGAPKIEAMHLLGGAVGAKGDWRTLNDAVSDRIFNYHSENDPVLKVFYRTAQGGQRAIGAAGLPSKFPKIVNRNVSRTISGHSAYFKSVRLT